MRLKTRLKKRKENKIDQERKPISLYKLIGVLENGELTSKKIEDFLTRNTILHPEIKKRLLEWRDEFKFWEDQAPDYYFVERAKYHRDLVKAMRSFIKPKFGETWGDFGSGPAIMSKIIWEESKESVRKIIALDIVLDLAKERIKEVPVLKLEYGNLGEKLDFNDETFDGIVSNIAILYVIEFEGFRGKAGMMKIFKELFRVLKPGGQLIWSTPTESFRPEICFISAIPDVIRERKNVTGLYLKLPKYLKYGYILQRKAKEKIYTYLPQQDWDKILKAAGFISFTWKFVFWAQCYVNKVYRPVKIIL